MPYPLTALPKAVFWAAPLRTWEYSTKQLRFLFAKEFWKETKKPKKPMDVTWNRCLGDCRMCHAHSCQVLETRFVTCEGLSDRNQTQLIINSSQTTIYLLGRLEYELSTKLYQTTISSLRILIRSRNCPFGSSEAAPYSMPMQAPLMMSPAMALMMWTPSNLSVFLQLNTSRWAQNQGVSQPFQNVLLEVKSLTSLRL